ncbi:J domain-containing protein, partial [bacterium]|nr:J domain-containing protein [bacterium]
MLEYYTVLEIRHDASHGQIKAAWRAKANKYHPDKNPDDEEAAELFKSAKHAYDILIDPITRKIYDSEGDVSEDPLFIDAIKKITEAIIGIIETTDDVENHDLLALLQMNIGNYINSNEQTKADLIIGRRKYEKVSKKFIKRRGGFNIFTTAIQAKMDWYDKTVIEVDHNIAIAEKMLD